MKVTSDRARYDEWQAELVSRIADAVRGHVRLLLDGRVPPDLNEVTRDIVFSVTSILDACDGDTSEMPMLTFTAGDTRSKIVVPAPGEGSWMYEYAHG